MSVIKESIIRHGHGPLNPSYFCVHSTANIGATAKNHVDYWAANDVPCTHLVSDWTEAYHTVPYDELCWQVGNGNACVEGLEICEATNADDFRRSIEIAAQVVRERLAAHSWGIDRLICHAEASKRWGGSDHTDPIPYFAKWGYSWEQFKQLVDKGGTGVSSQDLYDTKGNDGRNIFDSVIQTRNELKDRAMDALWQAKGNDGRNIFDSVIQSRYDIADLKTQLAAQTAAIEALSKALGANPADISKIVADAVRAKLDSLEISVTATDKTTEKEG
ncbi:peptidoglycan recognition protein family protein [Bifidobacterium adolescentis]|uniref:peptidoglycan recognition protein family protein n=1 Tax=Bifidobacterium adolescentis TaxID=1680 RepID=UPI003D78FAB1